MSGILALIGRVSDSRLRSGLQPLRYLGGDREQVWSEGEALVVVTRKEWQLGDDFSGNVLVLEGTDLVVAADASLFDKKGLARKLSTAGVRARGETSSHYLEAAYRAWGPAMVEHLNGDYAFVIWDRLERKLLAARDPIGGRPMFVMGLAGGIAVGSSARALAEIRGGAADLNLANLGTQVAGLTWSSGVDTVYSSVDYLLPGRRLTWQQGRVGIEDFWHPTEAPDRHPAPAPQAAEELRELICSATAHRLAGGVNSVWMSGGWDSTSVFAAGQRGLPPEDRERLRPVSISYPVGDPGREDELITQVADRWQATPHWINSDDLSLLDDLEARTARHDEPKTHLYELWNRGLARGTRAVGARVALDGGGGDQLFQVSDIFMADLLRTGHWIRLARFAQMRRSRGWRHLVRACVLPLLPDLVIRAGERSLGRRIPRHYLERGMTGWIRPEFVREHRLRERDLELLRCTRGSSLAQTENLLYLKLPIWGWSGSFMRGSLLEEGVEVRSPLLDLKVVEFALRRPIQERADGTETKILLRRAMEGLLPAEVLAPRTHRTGVTVGFSRRRMREGYPTLFARVFAEPLRLVELGIVKDPALRAAADRYLAGDTDEFLRVNLFHTMKTELWLRGLERRAESVGQPGPERRVAVEIPAA